MLICWLGIDILYGYICIIIYTLVKSKTLRYITRPIAVCAVLAALA
jgi:hypothetical protein